MSNGTRGPSKRDACRLRNATLVDTLTALQADGRVHVEAGHVQLAVE